MITSSASCFTMNMASNISLECLNWSCALNKERLLYSHTFSRHPPNVKIKCFSRWPPGEPELFCNPWELPDHKMGKEYNQPDEGSKVPTLIKAQLLACLYTQRDSLTHNRHSGIMTSFDITEFLQTPLATAQCK